MSARSRRIIEAGPGGDAPDFSREGRDWPNRAASRFVEAGGLRWHVQILGEGPVILLLHGTGAATHSFRDLAPRLVQEGFRVIAPDLPGHGFTQSPPPGGATLPGMAAGIAALLAALDETPALAAGHSAGAAILIRMALDRAIAPRGIVGLNAALVPFGGAAAHLFSPLAKLLVWNPFVPKFFAWSAGSRANVERLITETGSAIDAQGVELYARLLRCPDHVSAALRMMAHWDLEPLQRDITRLAVPLLLVTGARDRSVPPEQALAVKAKVAGARVESLPGKGHLAHEQDPLGVAKLIAAFAQETG